MSLRFMENLYTQPKVSGAIAAIFAAVAISIFAFTTVLETVVATTLPPAIGLPFGFIFLFGAGIFIGIAVNARKETF